MAVDGSRWQFLGRSPSRLVPRVAIDNEFFRMAVVANFALRGLVPHPLLIFGYSRFSVPGNVRELAGVPTPRFSVDAALVIDQDLESS